MKQLADELHAIVGSYADKLRSTSNEAFSVLPGNGKWSKKQELGHLIDSAHTNLRRFVTGQYEDQPGIVYNQDFWVSCLHYHEQPVEDIIELWKLMNKQIAVVFASISKSDSQRLVNTGKGKAELHTIEWLAADYLVHLRHHLHHILELEVVS